MKKNILTIIILALGLINMILCAVIVFAVVPTTLRTNNLIAKVATSIDLELESNDTEEVSEIAIEDIEIYPISEELTINLKKDGVDAVNHFALVSISFSVNKTSPDYSALQPTIATNESYITEIISEEFAKYTINDVSDNKEIIKGEILRRVKEYFKSDFIFSMSVGKLITQ